MTNKFGNWIKMSRLQAGLTQAAVEKEIDASSGMVSHWENGKSPSSEYRKKLEKLFEPIDAGSSFDGEKFGKWLDQEMRKKPINRIKLSQKSGVHPATIDNLITGKVANPRSETMRKLAEALGHSQKDSVASEVIEETKRNNEIPGLGSFENFSPHVKDEIPDCAGVYVLYDIADRPIYVGQSESICGRIKNHQDRFWFKEPIVKQGAYIKVPDDGLRKQLEKILIKFLKSNAVLNQHYTER